MRKGILFWLALCLSGFLSLGTAWAEVSSQVDRAEAPFGEAITLTLLARNTQEKPDLSVLERDFDLAGQRQESRWSYINGAMQQQSTWILTLYPKRDGKLSVPVINFGQEYTLPIALTITQAQQSSDNGSTKTSEPDIMVEFEVDNPHPYVQQQVILTQRLLYAIPLQRGQASLTTPTIEEGKGVLRQLDKVVTTVLNRNGKKFNVIERRFALIPEQSGKISIGRTVFEGVIADPATDNEPQGRYYAFPMGRPIRRFSRQFDMEVATQPADYQGEHWLPAKNIGINAEWSKPLEQMKAGEPITLTLGVTADGLMAEQLPALTIKPPVGIKAYTDQPRLSDQNTDDGVVGIRQENWVMMATQEGDYTLPEISLDWWNVKTGKAETARFPSTVLHVQADPNAQNSSAATTQPIQPEPLTQPAPLLQQETLSKVGAQSYDKLLLWLLGAVLLGVVGAIIWLRHIKRSLSRHATASIPSTVAVKEPAYNGRKALMTACQRHDAQGAYEGMLALLRHELILRPPYAESLRQRGYDDLAAAFEELTLALYSADKGAAWRGQVLLKALNHCTTGSVAPTRTTKNLEPLYPTE